MPPENYRAGMSVSTITSLGFKEIPVEAFKASGDKEVKHRFEKKRKTMIPPRGNSSRMMKDPPPSDSNRFFDTFTKFAKITNNLDLSTQNTFLPSSRVFKPTEAMNSGINTSGITT